MPSAYEWSGLDTIQNPSIYIHAHRQGMSEVRMDLPRRRIN